MVVLHAEFAPAETQKSVRQAAVALFTIGHTALESGDMPPQDVLGLVQALTMPAKLQEVSALSPHLTPRYAQMPEQHSRIDMLLA